MVVTKLIFKLQVLEVKITNHQHLSDTNIAASFDKEW